jgi:3-oxoacyl-[acyl-carrier-protein] synthase III
MKQDLSDLLSKYLEEFSALPPYTRLLNEGFGPGYNGPLQLVAEVADRVVADLRVVLEQVVDETMAAAGLQKSAIDWLIPHQANARIIEATARKLGLPMDKVIVTVDRHANTSAASIPLALDEAARDGRIRAGQHVLLEAVGGGFTWGAVLMKWS